MTWCPLDVTLREAPKEMRIGALATTRRCGVRSARRGEVKTAQVSMVLENRGPLTPSWMLLRTRIIRLFCAQIFGLAGHSDVRSRR